MRSLALLLLLVMPLSLVATEIDPSHIGPLPSGFQIYYFIGGDLAPGEIVSRRGKFIIVPTFTGFAVDRTGGCDLHYSITLSREGFIAYQLIDRVVTRPSSLGRSTGSAIGSAELWDVPPRIPLGVYQLVFYAQDRIGRRSAHRTCEVVVRERGFWDPKVVSEMRQARRDPRELVQLAQTTAEKEGVQLNRYPWPQLDMITAEGRRRWVVSWLDTQDQPSQFRAVIDNESLAVDWQP